MPGEPLTFDLLGLLSKIGGDSPGSPGLQVEELSGAETELCIELLMLGLIDIVPGWRDSRWCRLTEAGRARVRKPLG